MLLSLYRQVHFVLNRLPGWINFLQDLRHYVDQLIGRQAGFLRLELLQ